MQSGLTNRAEVRRTLLALCERLRPGWRCTRVSSQYLDTLDARIRAMITADVKSHPTLGTTFKP